MRAAGLDAVTLGGGAEIGFRCPEHGKRTGHADQKPSASLNYEKGVWRCYSCGARGSVKRLLGQHFVPTPVDRDAALDRRKEHGKKNGRVRLPSGFRVLDKPHAYLKLRGIRTDTVKDWGLGIANDYIIAPATAGSKLIGWVGRAIIPGLNPRCDMPKDVSDFVLGYNQAVSRTVPREVVIVEGMFDAFKVWQAGFPVIAVLGQASVARRQFIHALKRPLIVFPDADDGGVSMEASLLPLATSRRMRIAMCPGNRADPGECTVKEIKIAIREAA